MKRGQGQTLTRLAGCMVAICSICTCAPAYGGYPAEQQTSHTLESVASLLAKQYDCTILVDPVVAGRRTLPPPKATAVSEALGSLAAIRTDLTYRRVYLPAYETLPPAAKLAAWARALDRLEVSGLAIEDSKKDQEVVVVTGLSVEAAFENRMRQPSYRRKPLYVLYSRTATDDGKTAVERLGDLEKQQLELMSRLTPEQMPNPALQTMELLQSMEPNAMQQFAARVGTAGNQLWDRTPPEERQEMISGFMKVLQTYSGRPGEAPRPRSSALNLNELKRITKELEVRHHVRIVIDPAAYLLTKPVEPPKGAEIDAALEAVVKPLEGLSLRKLLLPAQDGTKAVGAGNLARTVREIEKIEGRSVVLENPATRKAISYSQGQPALTALKHDDGLPAFSPETVYLIYTASPDGPLSAELRYADLQRRQLEMMLQMGPEELSQAMELGIQRYQTQPTERRTSYTGLPMMAWMMASWFPRAAKEGGVKP